MFWAVMTPRLVIMDPELMKEILSNKLGHFGKPPLTPLILILSKDWHVKRVRGRRDTEG
jgi:hypothetical protein